MKEIIQRYKRTQRIAVLMEKPPREMEKQASAINNENRDEFLRFITDMIALATSKGKAEGMKEEALGCHEHCEEAKLEERKRCKEIIKGKITESGTVFSQGWNKALERILSALEEKK
jgi:hypothetical protein